jgi:glycosyltransferase involved in cell wall biosynthesis
MIDFASCMQQLATAPPDSPRVARAVQPRVAADQPAIAQTLTVNTPVSVVTVTYNNAVGLRQTLQSLAVLQFKPLEVLIVDGGSTDDTLATVAEFDAFLPLRLTSEPDNGIYDAMNKGLASARGKLIHYLNAGDSVWGEPYRSANGPSLLTVRIVDEAGHYLFDDFLKFGGFGYCHQGILFPATHRPYDTALNVAADLDLLVEVFPGGLQTLPRHHGGGALFGLGGLSTLAHARRDREVRRILWRRLPRHRAVGLIALLMIKNAVPRSIRRRLVRHAASQSVLP